MIEFQVPLHEEAGREFASFSVDTGRVLFAGSRHGYIDDKTCSLLVDAFGRLGFSFLTGCANGIDRCFRRAFADCKYKESFLVACAFKKRALEFKGLFPLFVVPKGLPPRAALAKRTLWMTARCSVLVLFPFDFAKGKPFDSAQGRFFELMGRGSALAFRSAIMNNKPVFVAGSVRPSDSDLYSVYPTGLFGLVSGFWCVPPVYEKTGLCYEQA